MSSPPSPEYRYSTATLDWARDEHESLDDWPARRAEPHRPRAALLSRWLGSLFDRIWW
ncbi:hypothetical protein [Halorussus litoreus]|uniref:hypothetical protein n=1 Tax=Halorussus litoreus TaxID=1710536 RepID=UPI0013006727|nr:hypothetical protein [Halorussus litoreus]